MFISCTNATNVYMHQYSTALINLSYFFFFVCFRKIWGLQLHSSSLRIIWMCWLLSHFPWLHVADSFKEVETFRVSALNMWIRHLMSTATLDTLGIPVIEHGVFLLPVLYFLRLQYNYIVSLLSFLIPNSLIHHSLLFQIHGCFIH